MERDETECKQIWNRYLLTSSEEVNHCVQGSGWSKGVKLLQHGIKSKPFSARSLVVFDEGYDEDDIAWKIQT